MAKDSSSEKSPLEWLLEPDDIGVRYMALRDLVESDKEELIAARNKAYSQGPIARVLENMNREGWWQKPGAGYSPKYTGTVWSVILLAQLGASAKIDERISTACSYLLERALTEGGQFSINGLPSATIDCLQGNLCASLLDQTVGVHGRVAHGVVPAYGRAD